MNEMIRTYEPLSLEDLQQLKRIALKEHEDFFRRNPKFKPAYYDALIGACLCQGAAMHYIDKKTGIKDFDIWLFYKANPGVRLWCRRRKSIENGYHGKKVDLFRRTVPEEICNSKNPIRNYLEAKNGMETKAHLLEKAGIGLFPDAILGKTLWKGELVK